MKNIKELINQTPDKLQYNHTFNALKNKEDTKLNTPEWLTNVFYVFGAYYRNLWTDPLLDEQIRVTNDFLWFNGLKEYSPHVIFKAAKQVVNIYKYPPSIAEFRELATALQKEEYYEIKKRESEKNRLLEQEPNKEIAKLYIKKIKETLRKKSK